MGSCGYELLPRAVRAGIPGVPDDGLRGNLCSPYRQHPGIFGYSLGIVRHNNRKMKQIAVQACGAEESGAHRVGKPDESNSGEIKCMALVRMIYGDSGWDKKMSYRLIGRAFPRQRRVSFKITDAMQIENGRVLTEM